MLSLFCSSVFGQVSLGSQCMLMVNHKVTSCQDHHPRPPRPREIEAELRASSLAGFDWLKTPSPLSTHSLRTPRAATGWARSCHFAGLWLAALPQHWPLIGHWPAQAWTPGPASTGLWLHAALLATLATFIYIKNVLTRQINYIPNLSSSAFVLWCPSRERVTLIWFVPATQLLWDLYLLNIT